MLSINMSADRWYCQQPTASRKTSSLKVGQVVVAERKPFRIDRVTEIPTEKWPDKFVQAWRERGMPDAETWDSRPMRVTGFWEGPDTDTRGYGVAAPASYIWSVLPEHYSVCHKCLELPPCRHVHNESIMKRATARMAEDMAILPGVCHGCREPITHRQKSFTFPGANLIRPDLGDNSAVFHIRAKCLGEVRSYDERWAAAEPGRSRLFFCEGTQTIHHDGSTECDNPECVAKGVHADVVSHRCRIWHHPGGSKSPAGCWCLSAAA